MMTMNYTRRLSSTAALMALAAMGGIGGSVAGSDVPADRVLEVKRTSWGKIPTMREFGTPHYHSSGRGRPRSQPKRRRLFRGISRTVSGRRK